MRLVSFRTKRRKLAAVAVGAVIAGGLAVIPALPASAAAACSVTYVPNTWTSSPGSGGFTTNITLSNPGDVMTTWTLRFTLPAGQTFSSGWSANWTAAGTAMTATNMSWNAPLATGANTSFGFQGTWSGTYSNPTAFTVNGVACNGAPPPPPTTTAAPPTTSRPPTSAPPTTATSRPPTTTAAPPTTGVPPTTASVPPGTHVDNPYAGSKFYVNPEWSAKAASEPGGSRVANQSTAVWLDSKASIQPSTGHMGLAQHLDAALAQQTSASTPVTIQIVIYDLPGRDCAALASNGEIPQNGIADYRSNYIDPIAQIVGTAKYAPLHIVAIIEIDSLPNLVTNASGQAGATPACATMLQNGGYVQGVQYALTKLHAVPNVYNYIDAAHHGWVGWSTNFNPFVDLLASTAAGAVGGKASVDGFIVNTANYSALSEAFFPNGVNTVAPNGQAIRNAGWVDFNDFVDEQSFATAFRNGLVSRGGFASNIGMLIDTSRNGWGGSARPTAASTSQDLNTFVNASRIDRRIHAGNWCNQSGAGLGERPRANPVPGSGIDAFVWVKPPGESDGSSSLIPTGPNNPGGKGFDQMCDPNYGGNARNGMSMSGALANAPVSGAWFSAQFQQLMANAFPPL